MRYDALDPYTEAEQAALLKPLEALVLEFGGWESLTEDELIRLRLLITLADLRASCSSLANALAAEGYPDSLA